ncbi:MAG: hypothetical protein K1X55_15505 [Chitinophagales bacterium]|nr:hypothetical protein [Chitinophagales bacterium]
MEKFYKYCYILFFILQINTSFSQGTDVCASGTLLTPTVGSADVDYFTFANSLTPTSVGTPDPTGFYYTVSAENEIFLNAATCDDIWYRVQVPASGGFALDVIHTGIYGSDDLSMAVYSSCSGPLLAAGDDYYTTDIFYEPTVMLSCLTPGSIVYVRIWQYGCDGYDLPSDFAIVATDMADLATGDAPQTAQVIANTNGVTNTATTIDDNLLPLFYPDISTSKCSAPGYAIAGGCEDKWYKITVPSNKILDVGITGASTNITLQAFSGTACALSEIACASNTLTPKINDIAFLSNTDVFIRVFDQNCDEYSSFNLETTIRPKNLNDLPCSAQTLTVGGATITDTLLHATPNTGIPISTCSGEGAYCRDIWFQVTATSSNTMKIKYNVTGNLGIIPNGVFVAAYSAATCNGPFNLITCKAGTTTDSLQYFQSSGAVSWIRVMDFNCDTTAHQIFTIQATQVVIPPNDNLCNAISLNDIDTLVGSIINATQSATAPNPTCNYTTANTCEDIWYAYTFTAPGTFDLKSVCLADCASNTTNIAVYTDSDADPCNASAMTQISCNTSGGATTTIACIEGFTNDKYYFRIYDYDCNNNNRQVTLYSYFTPANNSLPCNAYTLDNGLMVDTAETCGVTSSPAGTPDPTGCGFSSLANCENVWYKATIPSGGSLTITINPDYFNAANTNDIGMQAYVDADNNPCNGGLTLQGTCANGNNVFSQAYTGLTPGNQLYIRLWDFSCNGLKDFSIQVTSNNNVLLTAAVSGTTINMACGETVQFFDEGDFAGNYPTHGPRTVTFRSPPGTMLKVIEKSIDIEPAKTNASCVASNTGGNDLLTIREGDASGSILANITGNLALTGRFGTYVSKSGLVTFTLDADNSSTNAAGFEFRLFCVPVVANTVITVNQGSTITYSDPGGALGAYPNNAFDIRTFCPSAAALAAGDKIHAIMNGLELETIWDKLYVFDGDSINDPLLGAFSGTQTLGGINKLGTLRATTANTGGCLTFMFVSDSSVTDDGFNATITTGKPIGSNGGETCASALDISSGGKFIANTFLATGDPRNTDPALCIPSCIAGAGTQPITQLEGTIWYKFTVPNKVCTGVEMFSFQLSNVSSILKGDANATYPSGTSGAQMVLYQTNTCIATPANWDATKVICYDILQNGDEVNVTGLTAGSTYYMMFDNFGGRPAVLDIIATKNVSDYDGDDICDVLDIDDDNDGIPDVVEMGCDQGTVFGTSACPVADPLYNSDSDSLTNDRDPDFAGCGGLNENGTCISFDLDGDGIPNYLDLDSDNDGIPDVIEAGGPDPDNNGIVGTGPSASIPDTDGDGLSEVVDINSHVPTGPTDVITTTAEPIYNSDCSGAGCTNADYLDQDSDDDGIPDIIEAGGIDVNGDGIADGTGATGTNYTLPTDGDVDGWTNVYDDGTPIVIRDTDGDGLPDYRDIDSDNDGIPDVTEAGGIDNDDDGRIDCSIDTDLGYDKDGFCDDIDPLDNYPDQTQMIFTPTSPLIKTNADAGSDGVVSNEGYVDPNTSDNFNPTFDADGLPNYIDLDSDNDGLMDYYEAQANTSGVSIIVPGADADGDGWPQNMEGSIGGTPNNNDSDNFADWLDIDSDNDGIVDNVEWQPTGPYILPVNTNVDGDGYDPSYDNQDGSFGSTQPTVYDHDSDGIPDYLDADSDGDSFTDINEAWDGTDGDDASDISCSTVDNDKDGLLDCYDAITAGINATNPLSFNVPPADDVNNSYMSGNTLVIDSIETVYPNNNGQGSTPLEPDWRDIRPLPVELLSFDVDLEGMNAVIQWVTAIEVNTNGYIIERSVNGTDFTPILHFVTSKGTHLSGATYQELDDQALFQKSDIVYYRLKIIDNNGTFAYSPIRLIKIEDAERFILFPNPATEQTNIYISLKVASPANLTITDIAGRKVANMGFLLNEGVNYIPISTDQLAGQQYLLKLCTSTGCYDKILIVTK